MKTEQAPQMTNEAAREFAQNLAGWIRASADAHENSFDKEACEKMRVDKDAEFQSAKEAGEPHAYLYGMFDPEQFYRMTLLQAVQSVTPADMVEPVYYLLRHTWNDMMHWSEAIQTTAAKPEA